MATSTKKAYLDLNSLCGLNMFMSSNGTTISAHQCRAARAWLNWSQRDLADKSGVSLSAIKDFERDAGRKTIASNRAALQRAIEEAGVKLIFGHNGKASGVTTEA
jgi:DNA-binding XRE family transcriptional regulator